MGNNRKRVEIDVDTPTEDKEATFINEPDKNTKFIEKKEICPARYSDGFIYLDFQGFGLVLPNSENHTEPEIEVFYQGEIGSPDFKFRI